MISVESNNKRKYLIITFCLVLGINIIFGLIGKYYDYEYEKGIEVSKRVAEEKFSTDEIENLITDLKLAAKNISASLYYFILKEIVCVVIAGIILYIPKKLYDLAKEEYLNELWPDDCIDFICEALIVIMLIWDIFISPFSDISTYSTTLNQVENALFDIGFENVLKTLSY